MHVTLLGQNDIFAGSKTEATACRTKRQQSVRTMSSSQQKKEVVDFYDDFEHTQKKVGVNLRHLVIASKIKRATHGLAVNHVLEIGCGIGTATSLLVKLFPKAQITATDISPKSIETARRHWNGKYPRIRFVVSDMTDYVTDDVFDVIVLPDVLEHIPFEEHAALFRFFRDRSHPDTKIFINIPSPYYLRWVRKNHPELLQIIDQEIYPEYLAKLAGDAGFEIYRLENHTVSREIPDYQFSELRRKDRVYNDFPVRQQWKIILRKQWLRLFK